VLKNINAATRARSAEELIIEVVKDVEVSTATGLSALLSAARRNHARPGAHSPIVPNSARVLYVCHLAAELARVVLQQQPSSSGRDANGERARGVGAWGVGARRGAILARGVGRRRRVACSAGEADTGSLRTISPQLAAWVMDFHPPKFVWRSLATMLLAGQVAWRIATGKVNLEQLQEQIGRIGPATMSVAMLTASFVGMVFTIQFIREFARLGAPELVAGTSSRHMLALRAHPTHRRDQHTRGSTFPTST
jgi:hypothetical protein